MANWRKRGGVAAAIGAVMLLGAIGFTGYSASQANAACPTTSARSSPPPVYVSQSNISLGGPLCLKIDRARFFAKERAALARQDDLLAAAERELAAARAGEATTAAKRRAAMGDARTAAEAELRAAAAAVAESESKVGTARTALDQLPQRRKIFLLLDEVKVPMQGREVEVRPGSDKSEWASESGPLRATDDASSEAGRAWREILGGATDQGIRKVSIAVAVSEGDDSKPVVRSVLADTAALRVFDPWLVLIGGLGLVVLAAGIVMIGWNTGLLRDGGPTSPFSLGRVQMAWWLVFTIGGFLFIWLVSGQWKGVVTSGVIGLLGISATTGVASRLVDTRGGRAADGGSARTSVSFWTDLADDGAGAALHRIQLIAWTLLLGAVFAWTVIRTFGFPDFDPNLLLLAGIAGGTYLGFKFQEENTAPATPATPATPAMP